jgi:phosphoserine phosphatase
MLNVITLAPKVDVLAGGSEVKKLQLVVFDVDGTLLKAVSSWQLLHERLSTWDRGKQYAEQFFRGAITYEDWARLDASLWGGLKLERIRQIVDSVPYCNGARHIITNLRKNGFKVVLLSAGLSIVTERIEREVGVDDSLANELKVEHGLLTGEVKVNVSFDNKDTALLHMLKSFNLEMDDCVAVGDDETMIPLFEKVSLSIAFNPRSRVVEERADIVVKSGSLSEVLSYILGKKNYRKI